MSVDGDHRAGAAFHRFHRFMQRADEMDAAQYNRRANKINKMHLLRTNQVPFLSITNVAKF